MPTEVSSAPTCPQCASPLKDDYGMVSCANCGAIVFIDMGGNAHVATGEEASGPADTAAPEQPSDFFPQPQASSAPGAVFDFQHDSSVEVPSPMEPSFGSPNQDEIVVPAQPDLDSTPAAGDLDMNGFLGYEPEGGALSQDGSKEDTSQIDPQDPLGISAYANSEISGGQDGPLVVTLVVSGIDTKDLRDEIRLALQDPRFGWDGPALMAGLKNGVLRLERIAPVKATIVVNRLKHLAVQIRWEQNAITEIDPNS